MTDYASYSNLFHVEALPIFLTGELAGVFRDLQINSDRPALKTIFHTKLITIYTEHRATKYEDCRVQCETECKAVVYEFNADVVNFKNKNIKEIR